MLPGIWGRSFWWGVKYPMKFWAQGGDTSHLPEPPGQGLRAEDGAGEPGRIWAVDGGLRGVYPHWTLNLQREKLLHHLLLSIPRTSTALFPPC